MRSAKLGELCEIRSGGTPSRKNADFYGGAIPWAKISDIEASEGLLTTTEETITEDGLAAIRGRLFTEGTLLFAIYGSIGKMAFAGRKLSTNQAILGILNQSPSDLFDRYLFRYLEARRDDLLGDGAGIAQKNLSAAYVRNLTIPLPPLDEQKRISGILDQADALRRLRARALDKLNTLGQAIFDDMFEDGRAPKIEIRDLGRVQTGSTPSTKIPEYFEGDIPFVTPGDLEVDGPAGRYVSEEGAENSRIVQRGATLVCCIGATIGKMGISDKRSAFNQQINAVEWSDEVLPEYGLYAMRGIKNEIIHIGKGAATTLPILKKSLFEKMKICVAPLDEQKTFIDRVQEIEVNKRVFIDALGMQSSLFASLQHRAFRGDL